jgi:hypothetical protein
MISQKYIKAVVRLLTMDLVAISNRSKISIKVLTEKINIHFLNNLAIEVSLEKITPKEAKHKLIQYCVDNKIIGGK